jgi:hypothetical protein
VRARRTAPLAHAAAALAAAVLAGAPARAGDAPGPAGAPARDLAWWVRRAEVALAAAMADREPVLAPPVPVAVAWLAHPRRLASLDLGAPLLAMVGSDLDRDRKAELYAITERDVIALDVKGGKIVERARAPLPVEPPAIRPRDAVATACFEHPGAPELRVRASTGARGARFGWHGGALVELGATPDFPVCTGKTLDLVPGRNHFGSKDRPVYDVRCRNDLVDAAGSPLAITAELGAGGALGVQIAPGCARCAGTASALVVPGIGTAYAIADLDRDGVIEIVAAGAGAPGDKDAIKVIEATAEGVAKKKPVHRTGFAGGVVAIVVTDIDGDGADEVIGATRLGGTTKVDLWQLNK